MTTTAKENSSSFEPAPEGTHLARCVQVIDLGTQFSEYYGTKSLKVLLGWELPECLRNRREDDKEWEEPFLVWKRYTTSLSKKAILRQHLESWRGKAFTRDELRGFDLKNILDKTCLINITHRTDDDKTFANVGAVMSVPKSSNVPDRYHDLVYFDIDQFDRKIFETFSENLQNTIMKSEEYQWTLTPDTLEPDVEAEPEDDDSDIPFAWLLPWATMMYPILGATHEMQTMF